jgi:ribose transport system permease protein
LAVALLVLNSKNNLDLSILGVVVAIGIGCLIGLLTGVLTTKLLIPSFMVTLGVWSASSGIAKLLSGGKPPIIEDPGVRDFALGHYMFGIPNLVLVAAAVVVLGLIAQNYTRLGRYSYMIGGAEDLVRQSGILVDRYKIAVFALSGLLAGLAGVMETARVGVGESIVGTGQMFSAITAVVIGGTPLAGGRGGVAHSVVGVLIIKVLESGMVFVGFPPYIQQSVQGFFVLVAVVATTWHLRARLRVVK